MHELTDYQEFFSISLSDSIHSVAIFNESISMIILSFHHLTFLTSNKEITYKILKVLGLKVCIEFQNHKKNAKIEVTTCTNVIILFNTVMIYYTILYHSKHQRFFSCYSKSLMVMSWYIRLLLHTDTPCRDIPLTLWQQLVLSWYLPQRIHRGYSPIYQYQRKWE